MRTYDVYRTPPDPNLGSEQIGQVEALSMMEAFRKAREAFAAIPRDEFDGR